MTIAALAAAPLICNSCDPVGPQASILSGLQAAAIFLMHKAYIGGLPSASGVGGDSASFILSAAAAAPSKAVAAAYCKFFFFLTSSWKQYMSSEDRKRLQSDFLHKLLQLMFFSYLQYS